jgi:hypothetical protein
MVSILESQPLAEGMSIEPVDADSPEKGAFVTVPAMTTGFHFVGYLMNCSADLVCLEPDGLRREITSRLRAAITKLSAPADAPGRRRQDSTGNVFLEAWVDDRRGESYCETPFSWGATVRSNSPEGRPGYTLAATLQLTQDIENYITAQAEGFIVQSPVDLRERILARHKAGLAAYRKHTP